MSATGRGGQRRKDDAYMTPMWCVEALLKVWFPEERNSFLEPCVGTGNIVRAVNAAFTNPKCWTCIDTDLSRLPSDVAPLGSGVCTDFLAWEPYSITYDCAIMNPPYRQAEKFVKHALSMSKEVAALLRLGFLASQKRANWLRENTPDVYVLPKRPSFTDDGKTDAADYAWMVWDRYRPYGVAGRVVILEVP